MLFVAATPGRAERTIELLKEYDVLAVPVERADDARYAAVLVAIGSVSRGFRLPDAGLQIYAETDVFEEERRVPEKRRVAEQGVPVRSARSESRRSRRPRRPRHRRVRRPEADRRRRHARRNSSSCATPARTSCSCRSSGSTWCRSTPARRRPPLDRLGGTSWERAKTKVKKAMRDMAEELLKLYAARKAVPGHAFSADSHWQQEFEDAFEYELTPDQKTAIADIKRDMESSTPMDRLLCGDVGYGKTEVAMRAAFKAVMDGKQVAFLAPTTILAFQHQKTLQGALRRLPGAHRHGEPLPHRRRSRRSRSPISRPARSTSSSARTACCRRTCSSATSGCSSSTRSSGSAWRTRRRSSSCKKQGRRADDDARRRFRGR